MLELMLHIKGYSRWYYITGFNKIFNITGSDNLVRVNGYFKDESGNKIDYPIEINEWLIMSVANPTSLPVDYGYYLAQDLAFDLPYTEPV